MTNETLGMVNLFIQ